MIALGNRVNDLFSVALGVGLCGFRIVRVVIPADVPVFTLRGEQFAVDLLLVVAQIFGNFRKPPATILSAVWAANACAQ